MKTKPLALLAFLAFPFCAWANGVKVGGIHYILDNGTKTASVTYTGVESYTGNDYAGDIVIPSSVTYDGTTYSVTAIGKYAFAYCIELKSIVIPNTINTIAVAAFRDCTGLINITIPNSVSTIENFVFHKCSRLTSISIGNSVTSIGNGAFWGCSSLTSIVIPNSVTSIGSGAFWGCI